MSNQSNILYYLTIILASILGLRLLQLQVFEHEKYKVLAKNNTTRLSILRAPRGVIYDRHGNILATSKQTLSVIVYPGVLRDDQDKEIVATLLSSFIDKDYTEIKKIFKEMDPLMPLPLTLDEDVPVETAIKIFENEKKLPGVAVEKQAMRYYPNKEACAHVVGYVGQINERELQEGHVKGLILGDVVGKDGLEKVYDTLLQGTRGESRVYVDRHGKSLRNKNSKTFYQKARKGKDLQTTIDLNLQRVAYESLKNTMGAAIAMNPKTGEVLALVSTPAFDPNIFTKGVPGSVYTALMQRKAFINRAVSAYTPGSIWKPFTSIAGLEHGVASQGEVLHVSGGYQLGGFRFGDWTNKEGNINLLEALAWSRNTYFYQIAKRMKPEWIADVAREFGAGKPTGIELIGESSGIVPDPEWKKKHVKEAWYPGNTLHLAIGQSFLLLTPMQAAKMFAGIANNGFTPQPHLVKNSKKEKLKPISGASKKTLGVIRRGLEKCVAEGTGGASRFEDIKVVGKTGSAEVKGYKHTTHGWFAAYAPAEDPEILVVVFVEGGGHGGSVAAPVARKIFEAYFGKMNVEEFLGDAKAKEDALKAKEEGAKEEKEKNKEIKNDKPKPEPKRTLTHT